MPVTNSPTPVSACFLPVVRIARAVSKSARPLGDLISGIWSAPALTSPSACPAKDWKLSPVRTATVYICARRHNIGNFAKREPLLLRPDCQNATIELEHDVKGDALNRSEGEQDDEVKDRQMLDKATMDESERQKEKAEDKKSDTWADQ